MNILILGAGALGSNITKILASDLKNEHQISVMDFDTVEERNITAGTQFYSREQIGQSKVDALQYNIFRWHEKDINTISEKLTENNISLLNKYQLIVDCFDNYTSRSLVQNFVQNSNIPCLHIGFSPEMTFAIEWREGYKTPSDIVKGMDICEMAGAGGFVTLVASLGALVTQEFILNNETLEFVGSKFSVREIV